jgi:amino acid transporter
MKLSLTAAILINLNIMLGSGIFVNTVLLAQSAQALGAFAYLLVGIILLPLIFTMSSLVKVYPTGTFYDFGAPLHPFIGFVSSWSYFTAKLASCALGVHVCISLLQTIFPALTFVPTLALDVAVVLLFALLNMGNLRMGQSIQYFFITFKVVPILFAIIAGLYLLSHGTAPVPEVSLSGMFSSIPFVLYAFTGFEASCSLNRALRNPEKDGPRAILGAYLLGITIVFLYQLIFYSSLEGQLGYLSSYLQAFPTLLRKLFPASRQLQNIFKILLHSGIASSSLGAAYGIMFSNSWNLYALAKQNHLTKSVFFAQLNRYAIPYVCVATEAAFAIAYLLFSQGNQIPLQQISSCGMTITYTLSALALVTFFYKQQRTFKPIPVLGLATCFIFIVTFVRNAANFGGSALLLFLGILTAGICMFLLNNKDTV